VGRVVTPGHSRVVDDSYEEVEVSVLLSAGGERC
jgi:hypothetical protein